MKKMNKKGFTLIELLAVIVILGLLMAIAIPSVTKYITQSRKKTLTSTIGNYMSALTNEVNNLDYTFTEANVIYAVPVECISLERGGTNPFGTWYPKNENQWAAVLVQYDDKTSSYTYGFTFKDSAGYGIYPTASHKLNEKGDQVLTSVGSALKTKNTNGLTKSITLAVDYTDKDNWNGFTVENDTKLVVLEAVEDGSGNKTTKCNVAQKN